MLRDVAPETVGYAVEDLDDNGIPELAIGTISGDDFYGKLVFDLYTVGKNEEALLIFSSIERDRYYYAGGNRFANLGSSSAADCFVTTLKLEGEGLVDMTFTTDPAEYLADCNKQGVGSEQSHIRFDTLAAHAGPADDMDVRDLLESVAQKNYQQTASDYERTMWSIVYCPEGRSADFYFAENYENSYGLVLQEKGSFLKCQSY